MYVNSNITLPVLIVSAVAAILVYFLFLTEKNEGMLQGLSKWIYDFLSFKKLTIEPVLKIMYIFCTLYITIISFVYIRLSFVSFLLMIVIGNILIRISYEMLLMYVTIYKNTVQINQKIKKDK